MLDKKDLKSIEELIQKNIKQAFADFYESIFAPYVDRNERDHEEIKEQLGTIEEHVKDHAKRINKLESITQIKI